MTQAQIPSTIDRVKLYHQGARIYRTLTARLDEQAREESSPSISFEVTGLPLSLQDETLKLLLTSQRNEWAVSDIKIGLHVARRDNLPEAPDEEELRKVERELKMLRAQYDLLEEEQALVSTMEPPERPDGQEDMPPPASPLKARLAMERFVNDAIETRIARKRAMREKIQKLDEEREDLQDRIARASSARKVRGNEVTKVVLATLTRRRGESMSVDLELSYMVPGARWSPQYTCRIERTGASADIQMRALVIQSSGEDWKNASLELSTADPVSWTELPKLRSLRIGKAQPRPSSKQGFRPAPKGAALLFRDYDDAHQRAQILAPVSAHSAPDLLPSRQQAMQLGGVEERLSRHEAIGERKRMKKAEMPAVEPSPAPVSAPPPAPRRSRSVSAAAPPSPQAEVMRSALGASKSYDSFASEAPMMAPGPAMDELDALLDDIEEEMSAPQSTFGGASPKKKRAHKPGAPATSAPSFQDLRLGSFTSSSGARGVLRTATRTERYMQIFSRSELIADFDVAQLLTQAEQAAMFSAHASMPHGAQDVRQAAGFFDYVYKTEDRVDVPSSGTYHSVPVDVREAECELRYVAVPREAQHVFREASIANPHRAPMLSGPAEIYVGDEYVLTTTLPTVAPMERFRLGLGVEQAIKCARNTSYREERSGRAVVATAELHHEIRIELVNNLERTIQCEVRERIPQPAPEAEVVIEEIEVTPAWEPYTQEERRQVLSGGRLWSLEIDAGEQVDLLAHYVVKIYANNEITGGNRRES